MPPFPIGHFNHWINVPIIADRLGAVTPLRKRLERADLEIAVLSVSQR